MVVKYQLVLKSISLRGLINEGITEFIDFHEADSESDFECSHKPKQK
jgi:hypothetical protein